MKKNVTLAAIILVGFVSSFALAEHTRSVRASRYLASDTSFKKCDSSITESPYVHTSGQLLVRSGTVSCEPDETVVNRWILAKVSSVQARRQTAQDPEVLKAFSYYKVPLPDPNEAPREVKQLPACSKEQEILRSHLRIRPTGQLMVSIAGEYCRPAQAVIDHWIMAWLSNQRVRNYIANFPQVQAFLSYYLQRVPQPLTALKSTKLVPLQKIPIHKKVERQPAKKAASTKTSASPPRVVLPTHSPASTKAWQFQIKGGFPKGRPFTVEGSFISTEINVMDWEPECKNEYFPGHSIRVKNSKFNWRCPSLGGVGISGVGYVNTPKSARMSPWTKQGPQFNVTVPRANKTLQIDVSKFLPGADPYLGAGHMAAKGEVTYYGSLDPKSGQMKTNLLILGYHTDLPFRTSFNGHKIDDTWRGHIIVKVGDTPDEVCVLSAQPCALLTSHMIKAGFELCEFALDGGRETGEYLRGTRACFKNSFERAKRLSQQFAQGGGPSCQSVSLDQLRQQARTFPRVQPPRGPIPPRDLGPGYCPSPWYRTRR